MSALNGTCILSQVFRQKEAAWRKKQNEDEAATWKMLVAERQGGGSGDSGVGMSKEELKIEQAKYEQQLVSFRVIQATSTEGTSARLTHVWYPVHTEVRRQQDYLVPSARLLVSCC